VANLGTLTLDLVARTGGFTAPLDKAARDTKKHMHGIESATKGASKAISDMKAHAHGAMGGMTDFEKSLMGVQMRLMNVSMAAALVALPLISVSQAALLSEKNMRLFSAAVGDAALSAKELEYVRQLSHDLGLEITATTMSYGKFMAAIRETSIEGAEGRKIFESVSGAATALGLSADETSNIFRALQQMMSKGKVQAEELRGQLGEHLPGAFQMAAKAMGVTTAELNKMMEDGKVFSNELLPKLAIELDKTYSKAAVEGATSAQAAINRMNNEIYETKVLFGKEILPGIVTFGTKAVEVFNSVIQKIGESKIIWTGWAKEFGQMMNGGALGSNWMTKAGRAEIAAAMDAQDQMTEHTLAEWNARFNGGGATGYTAQEKRQQKLAAATAKSRQEADAAEKKNKEAAKSAEKALREQEKQQRKVNAALKEQNNLLEESVKGWDLSGLGKGLLDNPLTVAKPQAPKFSLTGSFQTAGFGGNDVFGPELDPSAAAEMLAGMSSAPDFVGVDGAVGGPFGELAKIDEAQEKLAEWYNSQLEMLDQFRSDRADLSAVWDSKEQDLDKKHQAELLRIEQARQSMQLQAASSVFGDLAGMSKSFAGEQSSIYKTMFAVSKAFAIADSIVQISAGIAKAANNPWPINLGAMATVAAATAGIVSSIQSVAMVGMAHDGIDSVPKEGTWLLNKGERVTTAETSAKLDRTLDNVQKSQGGGAPIVNLYEDKSKAGTVNSRNQDGRSIIDIFVADLMGDGRTQKAMSRKFGLSPVGA